jgi:ABC-type sugar transport system ATPase subunit
VSADGRSFEPGGGRAAVPLRAAAAPGPAVLGIRPEHLRVAADGRGAPLGGRVVVDEYLGADRCLHLDGPAGRLVVRVAPDGPRAIGSEVALQPDPARVRLYDPASGARIL